MSQRYLNTHYRAEQIRAVLPPDVIELHEPEILETGGGLENTIEAWDPQIFVLDIFVPELNGLEMLGVEILRSYVSMLRKN